MLALVRDGRRNPPLAFQQVAEPQPGPGEALVEVQASSVNRGELALLGSRDDGWRPGQDVSGVVIEPAGDRGGPSAGSRVVALVEGAAWSQRVAVPLERLATIDNKVTLEQELPPRLETEEWVSLGGDDFAAYCPRASSEIVVSGPVRRLAA
jgi:NADPH:quinone reductase